MPAGAAGGVLAAYLALALAVALATGLAAGAVNSFLVAVVGIPPILATLGTMQLFTGLAIVITQGYAVVGYPDAFLAIGSERLWIFPIPFVVFVACAVAVSVLLTRTGFGLSLYV